MAEVNPKLVKQAAKELDAETRKNVDAAQSGMSDARGATGRKATRGGRGGRRSPTSAERARDERTPRR